MRPLFTFTLTPTERLEIYEKALERLLYFLVSNTTSYICPILYYWIGHKFVKDGMERNELRFPSEIMKGMFPEFDTFKPERRNYGDAWFDISLTGMQQRIDCMRECIRLVTLKITEDEHNNV